MTDLRRFIILMRCDAFFDGVSGWVARHFYSPDGLVASFVKIYTTLLCTFKQQWSYGTHANADCTQLRSKVVKDMFTNGGFMEQGFAFQYCDRVNWRCSLTHGIIHAIEDGAVDADAATLASSSSDSTGTAIVAYEGAAAPPANADSDDDDDDTPPEGHGGTQMSLSSDA